MVSLDKHFIIICATAIGLVLSSCRSLDSNLPILLEKGMRADDVIILMGEPEEIRAMQPLEMKLVAWIYKRDYVQNLKLVQTGQREVPYVDPITGIHKIIYEPILNPETTTIHETIELMFSENTLVAWKRYQDVDIEYMNH